MIGVQRVTVYIDGFNLYYALLKPYDGLTWRRLDPPFAPRTR